MAFNPAELEDLIKNYSSLTKLMITLGFDAVKAIKALFSTRPDMTVEQQDAILTAVMADAAVREALALADAGQGSN